VNAVKITFLKILIFFYFFNVFFEYADLKNNFKKIKKYHFNFNIFLNKKTL